MKYPAYPKYKDSGVAWLGEVPDHWDSKKLTYCFKKIGSGTTPKSDHSDYYDGNIPWVTTSELREETIYETKQMLTQEALAEHSALKIYPVGTILMAMYGATIGRLGMLGIEATVNQACCAFAWPTIIDGRYLFFWLLMRRPILVSLSTGGGQPNLSQDDLRQIRIPLPPLHEQHAIAAFLGTQTSKLDALIAKKHELIAKLQEKRAALITRTVTHGLPPKAAKAAGLDPHPKMKDSGVEWLGEVPECWEVKRLRFAVSKIEQGWSPQCYNHEAENGEWGVLKVGCVNMFRFNPDQNKALPEELEPKVEYKIEENDILMSRANTRELLGSAALVERLPETKLLLCDKLYRIRATPKLHPSFLVYFMSTAKARFHFEREATGTSGSMQNIGQDTVKNLPILIPPCVEQLTILEYIQQRLKCIDIIMERAESVIRILQEYRSALITAAVTGKIDVRNIPPEAA